MYTSLFQNARVVLQEDISDSCGSEKVQIQLKGLYSTPVLSLSTLTRCVCLLQLLLVSSHPVFAGVIVKYVDLASGPGDDRVTRRYT